MWFCIQKGGKCYKKGIKKDKKGERMFEIINEIPKFVFNRKSHNLETKTYKYPYLTFQ